MDDNLVITFVDMLNNLKCEKLSHVEFVIDKSDYNDKVDFVEYYIIKIKNNDKIFAFVYHNIHTLSIRIDYQNPYKLELDVTNIMNYLPALNIKSNEFSGHIKQLFNEQRCEKLINLI